MRKTTETRIKLLETATRLIWQSNYAAVGVAEICKQAGVTKGSFYHYFDTKADLFYAASQHHWEELKADFDAMLSPNFTPLEQLENLINLVISRQSDEIHQDGNPVTGCPFFTSGNQVGAGEEKVRQAAAEMSDNATKYNTALVRSLKGGGFLDCDIDPEQTGRMIHHFIHGILTYGRIHNSLDVVKRDLRHAIYRLLTLKQEYQVPVPV